MTPTEERTPDSHPLKEKYRIGKSYKRCNFVPKWSRRRGKPNHRRYMKWAMANPKCRD